MPSYTALKAHNLLNMSITIVDSRAPGTVEILVDGGSLSEILHHVDVASRQLLKPSTTLIKDPNHQA
jgi:hypothetical protein